MINGIGKRFSALKYWQICPTAVSFLKEYAGLQRSSLLVMVQFDQDEEANLAFLEHHSQGKRIKYT